MYGNRSPKILPFCTATQLILLLLTRGRAHAAINCLDVPLVVRVFFFIFVIALVSRTLMFDATESSWCFRFHTRVGKGGTPTFFISTEFVLSPVWNSSQRSRRLALGIGVEKKYERSWVARKRAEPCVKSLPVRITQSSGL
jgi:hypothetical protein